MEKDNLMSRKTAVEWIRQPWNNLIYNRDRKNQSSGYGDLKSRKKYRRRVEDWENFSMNKYEIIKK